MDWSICEVINPFMNRLDAHTSTGHAHIQFASAFSIGIAGVNNYLCTLGVGMCESQMVQLSFHIVLVSLSVLCSFHFSL